MKKHFSLLLLAFSATTLWAQSTAGSEKKTPNGWHLMDRKDSGYSGISLDKAYQFLNEKKKKSTRVLVAVIDSGIDTLHEDLKPVLWVNKKEIPGNGKDDDKNGYTDDIHGWNFLGGKDGKNVSTDSYEGARVYHQLKSKWDGKEVDENTLNAEDKKSYKTYTKAKEKVVGDVNEMETNFIKNMIPGLKAGDSVIRKELAKEEYNCNDIEKFSTMDKDAMKMKKFLISICKGNQSNEISNKQILDEMEGQLRKADASTNPPPTYRKDVVQDDETNINDRNYGNNDVMASTPFHGTHCSGIIGAARNNGVGVNGVADNVSIMMLRAVPDGDEHDKDIANAIRYAVDNGARVVSMSFGKDFSPEKRWVDEAFKYAEKKGVLLVHAAGNDSKNIDTADNFPNPVFEDGSGRASNVITVGASGDSLNGGITARFSNYGKQEVDVFAPGVAIYSTIPGGNTYGNANGTSMACPVVAGIAALLMEYYPKLSAAQVKNIIEKSAVVIESEVKKPGTTDKVMLSEISKTGAVVNAYEAVKMAETMAASIKLVVPAKPAKKVSGKGK